MNRSKPRFTLLAAAAAAMLAACGGGSDEPVPVAPPVPQAARIVGTVASGAALAGVSVDITDAEGAPACADGAMTTAGDGSYGCTLASGAVAPFLVLAVDPSGANAPLVSIGLVTPGVDETAVINVTPLTTALVAQLAPEDNALAVVSDRSLIDAQRMEAIKAKALEQLAGAMAAAGVAAGFDPVATPMRAATLEAAGDAPDRLVEKLRFSIVDGQVMVAPADRPEEAVVMANAQTAQPQVMVAPHPAMAGVSEELARIARALTRCFALPVAERVLARDETIPLSEGGPEVTEAPAACNGIGDGTTFLHNGYALGQYFYNGLTSDAMVGAVFQLPELMLFLPEANEAHRAVVNFRYVDANGQAGNFIQVARRLIAPPIGDPEAVVGEWLLFGNQNRVHSSIQSVIVRREQLAPGAGSGAGLFGWAPNSRFETAFNIYVKHDGPGSVGLRAARVKGPGLPPAGVVLTPPDPTACTTQDWMNVRRKDGLTDPGSATRINANGTWFLVNRTQGVTGPEAMVRRPNPNEGNANNNQYVNWAHPLDYGAQPGSGDYIDFSQLRAMTVYTFEFFYEGEAQPRHTYDKALLTAMTPATRASSLQWLTLDSAGKRVLDPADPLAAAATELPVSWHANALVEPVSSVGIYARGPQGTVTQAGVRVPVGANSVIAPAPAGAACGAGAEFPTLIADGSSYRIIAMRYRMLDGSNKTSFTQFN